MAIRHYSGGKIVPGPRAISDYSVGTFVLPNGATTNIYRQRRPLAWQSGYVIRRAGHLWSLDRLESGRVLAHEWGTGRELYGTTTHPLTHHGGEQRRRPQRRTRSLLSTLTRRRRTRR